MYLQSVSKCERAGEWMNECVCVSESVSVGECACDRLSVRVSEAAHQRVSEWVSVQASEWVRGWVCRRVSTWMGVQESEWVNVWMARWECEQLRHSQGIGQRNTSSDMLIMLAPKILIVQKIAYCHCGSSCNGLVATWPKTIQKCRVE